MTSEIREELYRRALEGDSDGIKKLFEDGAADIESLFMPLTPCQDTVFHVAAYRGSERQLQVLLEMIPPHKKVGEVVKMKNAYGNTLLHEVAATGNLKAAELLIRDHQEVDAQDLLAEKNNSGETPFYRAAACGKREMVMYLAGKVEAGGQILRDHFKRKDDVSVLQAAVLGLHFETAIWLVERDRDLADYKDNNGMTCLHLLATMPAAFRSTSNLPPLRKCAYSCIYAETHHMEGIIENFESNHQGKDLEIGEPRSTKIMPRPQQRKGVPVKTGSKVGHAFFRWLVRGWKTMERIQVEKKRHESAVVLAHMLVERDTSWLVSKQGEMKHYTLCLDRHQPRPNNAGGNSDLKFSSPDTPLLVAASTGIFEIFEEIIKRYPQAIEHVAWDGRNVLHVAALHRQYDIFRRLKKMEVARRRLAVEIDDNGCTLLHYAALTDYYGVGTKPTAALQLQEEWKWFKEVENIVPANYVMHRNNDNHTAEELFKLKHEDQHNEAKRWVKDTAQSCSAVAVLIATVVFAAAFTVPGGSNDKSGVPVLLKEPMYSFFTVMDVAAVATSLTAVVIFLSVLTSSLDLPEFVRKVPRRMTLGFIFLFFSVTSTMLAFTATIILTIKLQKRWSTTLTYAAAFLPIGVFALVQFPLYFQFCVAFFRGVKELLRKLD